MYVKHHSYTPLCLLVKDINWSPSLTDLSAVPAAKESETLDD